MSIGCAHEGGGREWEPQPFELPLVNPGSSRLPPKAPLPYHDDGDASDEDTDESGRRVIVIDLA
jgi:hypothetical protein